MVPYCSRECQIKHYKQHKEFCQAVAHGRQSKEVDESAEEDTEQSRAALIQESLVTHVGPVIPGMPVRDGVPANFLLKHRAIMKMFGKKDVGPGAFYDNQDGKQYLGEATYRDFFQELVQNEEEWMEFFSHERNFLHSMQTLEILNLLADMDWKVSVILIHVHMLYFFCLMPIMLY